MNIKDYENRPIYRLIQKGNYDPLTRTVKVIKGYELNVDSKDWFIEAPLRMLFNVLDQDVAKDPKPAVNTKRPSRLPLKNCSATVAKVS